VPILYGSKGATPDVPLVAAARPEAERGKFSSAFY